MQLVNNPMQLNGACEYKKPISNYQRNSSPSPYRPTTFTGGYRPQFIPKPNPINLVGKIRDTISGADFT
jgi:hypothetical protein